MESLRSIFGIPKTDSIPSFVIRYSLFHKHSKAEVSFSIKLIAPAVSSSADPQAAGNPTPETQYSKLVRRNSVS